MKRIFIMALAVLLLAAPSALAKNLQLDCGVSLDLPDDWKFRAGGPTDLKMTPAGQEKIIFLLANSTNPAGGMIQVGVLSAKSADPYKQIIDLGTPEVLKEIENEFLRPLAQEMIKSGLPLLNMNPLAVETISGHKTLVISYRRQGASPEEVWEIHQYKIPLSGYMVEVTMGLGDENKKQIAPMLADIKKSIKITPVSNTASLFNQAGEAAPAAPVPTTAQETPAATPPPPVVQAPQTASPTPAANEVQSAPPVPPAAQTTQAAPAPQAPAAPASPVESKPVPAVKASFNCAKASTPVELAICKSPDLAALDVSMAKAYSTALKSDKANAKQIKQGQLEWLKNRESECPGPEIDACLRRGYESRIPVLQGFAK